MEERQTKGGGEKEKKREYEGKEGEETNGAKRKVLKKGKER